MIAYLEYAKQISNVREFYTTMCREMPLVNAKITDIGIVNENIALAYIESTYKDKISIGTSPVIKKMDNGKLLREYLVLDMLNFPLS